MSSWPSWISSSRLIGPVAALCVAAVASAGTLEVGNTAPALDVKKWINGEGTTLQPGKTYVVEFWATWCAPCKKSIPHLNEMHQRLASKGLTIIGMSDETVDTVSSFVTAKGDQMAYLVGVDRDKNTYRAWMDAAGQKGIPCAFVVDRTGKIVYIGHPLDDSFERVVKATLAGRFDPKKEKAAQPKIEAAERAAKVKNFSQAYKHFDEVIAIDPAIFADVAGRKFEMMLADEGNTPKAYEYAKQIMTNYASDPVMLTAMAQDITTNPKYDTAQRNLDVAMEFAQAAHRVGGETNPSGLAVLALVQFNKGQVNEAIENQMQAWMIASPSEKAEFKRVLDNYRSNDKAKANR